jgi:hypothetical protein
VSIGGIKMKLSEQIEKGKIVLCVHPESPINPIGYESNKFLKKEENEIKRLLEIGERMQWMEVLVDNFPETEQYVDIYTVKNERIGDVKFYPQDKVFTDDDGFVVINAYDVSHWRYADNDKPVTK